MNIPAVRDRVRVDGEEGMYRVVHVDAERMQADLACIDRVGFLTMVPLDKIQVLEISPQPPSF